MEGFLEKEYLINYYNKQAGAYTKEYATPAGQYFMDRKIQIILEDCLFEPGARILDVGCADGPFSFALAELGYRVIGIDLSPKCIKFASERAKRSKLLSLKFFTNDAENLSLFDDNSFDGVISFSCLRYLPDLQKSLKEIYRVIDHGKKFIF